MQRIYGENTMKKQIAILIATTAAAFGVSAATVHISPPSVSVGVPGVVVAAPGVVVNQPGVRGDNGLHQGQRKAHVNQGNHYGQYKNAGKGKRKGVGNKGRGKNW